MFRINEMIAEYNHPDDQNGDGTGGDDSSYEPYGNRGTLILDATCAPQQISYPQDINLLNEARENLEAILDTICYEYNFRMVWDSYGLSSIQQPGVPSHYQ